MGDTAATITCFLQCHDENEKPRPQFQPMASFVSDYAAYSGAKHIHFFPVSLVLHFDSLRDMHAKQQSHESAGLRFYWEGQTRLYKLPRQLVWFDVRHFLRFSLPEIVPSKAMLVWRIVRLRHPTKNWRGSSCGVESAMSKDAGKLANVQATIIMISPWRMQNRHAPPTSNIMG